MIKMEPPVSQIDRVRRALSPDFAMSNNSTPATDQMKKSTSVSEEEWKTPRKEGYPDQIPRSSARKWLKSEEAEKKVGKEGIENVAVLTADVSAQSRASLWWRGRLEIA